MGPGACLSGFVRSAPTKCVRQSDAAQIAPTSSATVLVESLLVNSTKFGGRCWDLFCDGRSQRVGRSAAEAAAGALGAWAGLAKPATTPFLTASGILAELAMTAWSHPDTVGHAYIITAGTFSDPVKLQVRQDTLTPQWGLRFEHVPLSAGTALRLELFDADPEFFSANDDMGIITIGLAEIQKAMRSQETYQVNVQQQTHDQVLFVGISVVPEMN